MRVYGQYFQKSEFVVIRKKALALVFGCVLCSAVSLSLQAAGDRGFVSNYQSMADEGNADAQYELGMAHSTDDLNGLRKDYQLAAFWFRKAAEQGHVDAQYELASAYSFSKGLEPDITQARIWFRKAAEQGHADAQYHLAYIYHEGLGISPDLNQAVFWFRKAAEQRHGAAQSMLGALYCIGEIVPQDFKECYMWALAGSGNGYADGNIIRELASENLSHQEMIDIYMLAVTSGYMDL